MSKKTKYTLLDFLSGGSIHPISKTQRFLQEQIKFGFVCDRELAVEKEDFLFECKLRFAGSDKMLKDASKLFDLYLNQKPIIESNIGAYYA